MTDKNSDLEISEGEHKELFFKKVGKNIRTQRIADGKSQKELAKSAQLQPTYLNEVEKGRRNFSMLILLKISRALDIAPKKLLQGTDRDLLMNKQ
ncbi:MULTISPECIES: helix-turn-helix domain-containing protein [unclassified Endozoicomonas]|uniref:helix-turn-helix domain-containing protein n=1 Tax=unclassified Endozoicomonas TaxID=2644528 RepID=UPI003BB796BE